MIYRQLKYRPLASQERFHRLTSRFRGFSGPVGSGKSAALVHEAIRAAYANPGRTGLLGAPSLSMLRDSTADALFAILFASRIPHRYDQAENYVVLPEPGSKILLRSLDNYEALRGTNLAWFGVDELTYCDQEAWLRLEARLRDPAAKRLTGFAVWTPKGFDWVYRRFIDAPVDGYELVRALPGENTHLAPGYYEALKTSYASEFFQQEGLGQYLNVTQGRAYPAFDRARNVAPQRYDPERPLLWTLDFNVDPMSSLVCQYANAGELRVLDEIVMRRVTTPEACLEFIRRYARASHVAIYGDASGARMQTSGANDYEMIRRTLRQRSNATAQFKVPAANPRVGDRLAAVNGALCNSADVVRIYVDPRCTELIADLEKCTLLNGELDKRDPKRTHISDALGYLVWQERPLP